MARELQPIFRGGGSLAETWQEALLVLHQRGWNGELVDDACAQLVEALLEGDLVGRAARDLTPPEVSAALGQSLAEDEARALVRVSEVHDRTNAEGQGLRDALRDLDAFAESLLSRR
jgi:hypothetical protein